MSANTPQTESMSQYCDLQQQPIIMLDSKLNISFWNQGARRLFGYYTRDVLGKNIAAVIPVSEEEQRILQSENLDYYETQVEISEHPRQMVHLFFDLAAHRKHRTGKIWLYAADISNLAKRLRSAEEANRTKTKFLADISHEIRTSLMGILGFCELLSKERLRFNQRESVETIHACSRQLLNLVNSVLDLSKIEAGQITLEMQPFDIMQTIRQTVLALQPEIQKKQLDFKLIVDHRLPGRIVSDETRIRQIVSNLLVNAIKYTDKGLVEVQVMKNIDEMPDPAFNLTISVRDTGSGIAEKERENIFSPFIQLKRSSQDICNGAGLGLAICKYLVEAMGGRIWYEPNQDSQGSVFSFTVPVKEAWCEQINDNRTVYESQSRAPLSAGTVLLAEDIEVNRKLIAQMLKNIGFDTITAENGQKCLETLQMIHPDVILMDMQMPVMDGFEAARAIKKCPQWTDIPIIALTAYAMQDDILKCTRAGCDHYLSKPFTQQQLEMTIKECFSAAARDG